MSISASYSVYSTVVPKNDSNVGARTNAQDPSEISNKRLRFDLPVTRSYQKTYRRKDTPKGSSRHATRHSPNELKVQISTFAFDG